MEPLTKNQRQQIRSILQDDKFRAVEVFLRNLKIKYQSEQVKANTEFETLWRVSQREAKVETVDNFLNGLIEQASLE